MEENRSGGGCLALIAIIFLLVVALFNYLDPDNYNNRHEDSYDDPNSISIEEESHCRELGGTEAMCEE